MTLRRPQGHPEHGRGVKTKSMRLGIARVLTMAAAMVIGGSSSVLACPVCFSAGADETHLIDGTKFGILALLAITLAVQGAFVAFFLYLRRRAKQIADVDLDTEWSQLQGGASRT
jgi:heme/copper-type cytochrome/quinol oxidase subunit 2